jgi:trehalose 6-phosphate phosphatase
MSAAPEKSSTALPSPPLPPAGTSWALFLDVDGTLVAFNDDPEMIDAPDSLRATLSALHGALDGALALVSGRRLYDLDRLFGPPLTASAGLHGLQRRRNDGSEDDVVPDSGIVEALHRQVAALAARLPRLRVEDKGTCIALHYREAPAQEATVVSAAREIAGNLVGYETQPGNHIIKIKPAGVNKGSAVSAFLDEAPFAGRVPVYLGDDLTDEHAFAIVNQRDGLSIRVGTREPTHARYALADPLAVQAWLQEVLARLGARPAH